MASGDEREHAGIWAHARGHIDLARPRVMAIVNVTPDSFFDGGRWIADAHHAPNASVIVKQCRRWIEAGADVLDLGGESTRPGAAAIDHETEIARVVPVIERLRQDPELAQAVISVDTRHAQVARRCLAAGADIINDVSTLADPEMAAVVAQYGAGLVISHLRGTPATMQRDVHFDDLLGEISEELCTAVTRATTAGCAPESILIDPGIGFGKSVEHSAALVAASAHLRARVGRPVLIGASRKSFIGALLDKPVDQRMLGSVAAAVVAVSHGASIVRVHDVPETAESLRLYAEIDRAFFTAAARAGGQR